MFTHVDDFVLRRPLFWLFRGPVAQSLAVEVFSCCDRSLEQLAGSLTILTISVTVQKVIEDGIVRVILH